MFSQKAAILGSEYIVYISSSLSRCAPILQEMSDYIQNNVCTVPRMHMEPSSSIPGNSLVLISSDVSHKWTTKTLANSQSPPYELEDFLRSKQYLLVMYNDKLDGVSPVDNRPSPK